MSYEYIRNFHNIEITINHLVRHTVTGRFGTVMPGRDGQYVLVLFMGDKRVMPCLPHELEAVDDF